MKKIFIIISFLVIAIGICGTPQTVIADDGKESQEHNVENELNINLDSIINNLDITEIENFLKTLNEKQLSLMGGSFKDRIKAIVSGDITIDGKTIFSYIAELLGVNFLRYLPTMLSIIGICVIFSIISSIKGNFASESVGNIVSFATISLVILILLTQIYQLIGTTSDIVLGIKRQINVFMPILLTLMTAIGASSSVAVYQPSVAILSSGIAEMISFIILPFFIFSVVFTVIGSLNSAVKLDKMSGFFSSSSKWLLGTAFFLFMAFLSVQGITASVYDGISLRTAKFAVSKYVPIIGGYLSEGLNLVLAGSVLVKNAVGLSGVILLLISVIPIIVQIVVFSLSLQLTSAIIEPIDNGKISGLLGKLSKNMYVLVAVVLAITFLYFIFLVLLISTGNLVI